MSEEDRLKTGLFVGLTIVAMIRFCKEQQYRQRIDDEHQPSRGSAIRLWRSKLEVIQEIATEETNMSIRPVKRLARAKPVLEGAGVHLRRAFGFGDPTEFDPFLLLDDFRNDVPADYRRWTENYKP